MEIKNNDKKYPEILNMFTVKISNDGKSKDTCNCYKLWLYNFIQFQKSIKYKCSKNKAVSEIDISEIKNSLFKKINLDDIDKYKDYLKNVRGNNGNSINRKLGSIMTFFKFLMQKKIIIVNIMKEADYVKQSQKVRRPLTKDQVERLLRTIKESKNRFRYRDTFLFKLFIELSCRETELTLLTLDRVEDNCFLLHGKGDKARTAYLSKTSIVQLKEYMKYRSEYIKKNHIVSNYLFVSQQGNNLSPSTVLQMLKEYATKAGLDANKIYPHILRHTGLTLLYKNNVDIKTIQEIAGHKNIATTKIYVTLDTNEENKMNAANSVILSF